MALRSIAAFSLVTGLMGMLSTSAQATPACPAHVSEAFSFRAPKSIAFHRTFEPQLNYFPQSGKPWLPVSEFRMFLSGPTGWTQPLNGWKANEPFPSPDDGSFYWRPGPSKLVRQHPVGRFTLAVELTNRDTLETCSVNKEVGRVQGVSGVYVPISSKPFFRYGRLPDNEYELELDCFNPTLEHGVNRVNGAPIEISLGYKGANHRLSIGQPCTKRMYRHPPRSLRTSRWKITKGYWSRFTQKLELDWLGHSTKPFRLKLRASQDGQRLLTSTFRVKWVSQPGRRIWWESDAFVNYCINHGRTTYSENGRLYCRTPDRTGYRVALFRG